MKEKIKAIKARAGTILDVREHFYGRSRGEVFATTPKKNPCDKGGGIHPLCGVLPASPQLQSGQTRRGPAKKNDRTTNNGRTSFWRKIFHR